MSASRGVSAARALRTELEQRIAAIPGIEQTVSRYAHGMSFALGRREIAHFHGDTRLDVRLTCEEIRKRKSSRTLDPRFVTRGSRSEWVEIRLGDLHDLEFAVSMVEEALRANQ